MTQTIMPNLNAEFSMALLGQAIRSKRTSIGLRIEDLAVKVGLSRKTIMKIENGDPNVSFSNIMLLMDALGLSFSIDDRKSMLNTTPLASNPNNQEDGWYE
ncbi:helix-turn-helix domain-containing protein [Vibrio splendidus]|nr:helix-turn-helix domain-containing protein [Vibrio splendidus]MCC4880466.1 helix-turn-helix domain-containing protein [Vibrio splendidus]